MEIDKETGQSINSIPGVFERVSDAFLAFDINWCFTYINNKAGEFLTIEPISMIGRNAWEVLAKSIGKPFHKACHSAMEQQNDTFAEEYHMQSGRWFQYHIYPSQDGLSVMIFEITQQKNAARELNNREQQLRALIENNFDIVSLNDNALNLIYRSPSSARTTA